MNWQLPENVATFGGEADSLYTIILAITAIVFVLVEVALVVFVVRYRHREGRRAAYIHGNTSAEVIWTLIPLVIVLFLAFRSGNAWTRLKAVGEKPEGALELRIAAKQFEWNVTYPGADGRLGTSDDFVKRNQLHIPVGRPVWVTLTAEDVIHSFFLPHFRVKQDAVPGMEIPVWFEATHVGEFVLGCAELCGTGHTRMMGSVTVHEADAFEQWQKEQGSDGVQVAGQ